MLVRVIFTTYVLYGYAGNAVQKVIGVGRYKILEPLILKKGCFVYLSKGTCIRFIAFS